MLKKIIVIVMITILSTSCITMKVDKDSPPMIDFGTPIVGHFRNKDTAKGILYTSLFLTFILTAILFAPTNNGNAIIPIDKSISDPIFYASLGCTGASFIGSSIDTAITYQIYNSKILKLNDVPFDPKANLKKYEVINNFRINQEEEHIRKTDDVRFEAYKETLDLYRKKLIDGTITDDELILIEKSEYFKENLKMELGYYTINKNKEKGR